jgi:hypothetical protein
LNLVDRRAAFMREFGKGAVQIVRRNALIFKFHGVTRDNIPDRLRRVLLAEVKQVATTKE